MGRQDSVTSHDIVSTISSTWSKSQTCVGRKKEGGGGGGGCGAHILNSLAEDTSGAPGESAALYRRTMIGHETCNGYQICCIDCDVGMDQV